MNELIKALMQRLVPGEGPPMKVPPPPSVMAPGAKPRDPRDLEGIQQGFDRGMLGNFLALPDLVTAGVNKAPGFAGLLTRGAFGRQKLPSDAAAEGMGLAGSGAGYDLGRAGADVAGMAMGMAGLKHKPVAGQANMWLGPSAPGWDREKGKRVVEEIRSMRENYPSLASDPEFATSVATRNGMIFDPGARVFLQPMPEIKDWKLDPDFRKILAQTPDGVPFADIFSKSVNMNKLPEAVKGALVKFDPSIDSYAQGAYNPSENKIKLGTAAFNTQDNLRDTVFHEATHAGARSMGFSRGTAPKNVSSGEHALSKLDLDRYSFRETLNNVRRDYYRKGKLPGRNFDLPPKLRGVYSQNFVDADDGYKHSIGELLAEESARMARGEKPNLDILSGKPLLLGHTPLPVADHLARMKADHPVLFKQMMARFPQMEYMEPNNVLFRELLGGRPQFGVKDLPAKP